MNLKVKAALITLGIVGGGLTAGYVLSQLPNWAVSVVVLTFACYMIYTVALSGLKYDKAIDDMGKKYEK